MSELKNCGSLKNCWSKGSLKNCWSKTWQKISNFRIESFYSSIYAVIAFVTSSKHFKTLQAQQKPNRTRYQFPYHYTKIIKDEIAIVRNSVKETGWEIEVVSPTATGAPGSVFTRGGGERHAGGAM